MHHFTVSAIVFVLGLGTALPVAAQPAPPGPPPVPGAGPPPVPGAGPLGDPKDIAPFDLSGYWVSTIVANWRFRMVVPGRGEYRDVPINREALEYADAWDRSAAESAGRQCEAYGAAALMRQPTRLRVEWHDKGTLRVETDNGRQTRLLRFTSPAEATGEASLQGRSLARWDLWQPSPFTPPSPSNTTDMAKRYGSLVVTTDQLLPGLLRKNGIPYSAETRMRESWHMHRDQDSGETWLTITTTVEDPVYLRLPYTYNVIFKREQDGKNWDPAPCSLTE